MIFIINLTYWRIDKKIFFEGCEKFNSELYVTYNIIEYLSYISLQNGDKTLRNKSRTKILN